MPIPTTAPTFTQVLDPSDVQDFYAGISQGAATDDPAPMLLTGESVASFTLGLTAEAVAAGLQIKSSGAYPAPVEVSRVVTFWLGVDPTMQGNIMFNGDGVTVGVELTITTNNSPPRIRQRTMGVKVANQ